MCKRTFFFAYKKLSTYVQCEYVLGCVKLMCIGLIGINWEEFDLSYITYITYLHNSNSWYVYFAKFRAIWNIKSFLSNFLLIYQFHSCFSFYHEEEMSVKRRVRAGLSEVGEEGPGGHNALKWSFMHTFPGNRDANWNKCLSSHLWDFVIFWSTYQPRVKVMPRKS